MKKIRTITLLLITFILIAGIFSCSEDDIIENLDNTRISKIKLEKSRKFHDYWVVVDIDYTNDKLSSIYLNKNSQQSNSGLMSQYEYNNEKITSYGTYKETYVFNGTNLIEWICENDINGQYVPLEKKMYEYENNNLISLTHILDENFPYKYDTLSYDGLKLKNYKSYYAPSGIGLQSELDKEGIYTYQDDVLLYIDMIDYEKNKIRYSFVYDGSMILKIDKQYVDDPERELLNYFEFSYDELGRIKTILYKSGIEDSYNFASEAKWTFEYEIGKSNLKFDDNKILWKIINIDAAFFPEKLINDFFTIYPE